MNKKLKLVLLLLVAVIFAAIAIRYLRDSNIAILNSKGVIADKERNLIYFTLGLVSIIVIPVFTLTILFSWRYREGNRSAKYSPNLDGSRLAETLWWLFPALIILVLSIVTWNSSHDLDPARPIVSTKPPLSVQVVAMNWKWLFIYPGQNIATVNFLQIPVNTPITFEITSDAPMNSFWVPQLGGQIYAMAGMSTQLHLQASVPGDYRGSSANISGRGFAGMDFTVRAVSQADFDHWVGSVKNQGNSLSLSSYNQLALPSENNPIAYYSSTEPGLYGNIINRYMIPGGEVNIQ